MALMSTHTPKPRAATLTAPLQRSFTLPTRVASTPVNKPGPTAEIGASEAIETLYVHPGAKIVSFSTSGTASLSRPSSSSSRASAYDGLGGESGTLAWQNATERTLAAGPLEIYRVPGSVSFLHSGNLLHAILPRSQCWCVDGVSKFAFRVRPDTYYRIELPGESEDDKELVEALKVTLAKVLYYERTSCPFRRGFGTDLPEMPDLPRRAMSRGGSVDPAKRWRFDRKWKPEGAESDEEEANDYQPSSPASRRRYYPVDESSSEEQAEPKAASRERGAGKPSLAHLAPLTSSLTARNMRSVTAPPQLTSRILSPIKSRVPNIAGRINRINEAVKHQVESAQRTPPSRRQPPADAPTPKLPPTPESIQGEFTQGMVGNESGESLGNQGVDNHGGKEDENETEEDEAEGNWEEEKDAESSRMSNWTAHEEEREDQSTCVPTKEDVKDKPMPEAETRVLGNDLHESWNKHDEQEHDTRAVDVESYPEADQISLPAHETDSPKTFDTTQNASEIFITDAHHKTRSQSYDASFDLENAQSIATTSPDPSLSSEDSWTSLPTDKEHETQTLHPDHSHSADLSASPSSSLSTSSSYQSLVAFTSEDALTYRVPSGPPLSLTQHFQQHSTAIAIAGTGALLVKRTAQIFLGPPAYLAALMLRIAARIIAGNGDEGVSLTTPVIPPAEAREIMREREMGMSSGIEGLGMTGVRELRQREEVMARGRTLGHRRVPGSFDFSDDEEEWGGM